MPFDHEKLDVYQRSLKALEACDRVTAGLPRGRANVRDQIERSSTSVVANIAEGAGEFSPAEKARFYRMARRSAIETVAWLQITRQRGESDGATIDAALESYDRVVSMLVRLVRSRGHGHGQGHGHGDRRPR